MQKGYRIAHKNWQQHMKKKQKKQEDSEVNEKENRNTTIKRNNLIKPKTNTTSKRVWW